MSGYLSNSSACLLAGNYAVYFGSRISDLGDKTELYKLPSPQPERSLHFQLKFIDNFSLKANAEKAPLLTYFCKVCSLLITNSWSWKPINYQHYGEKGALSAL